MTALHLVRRYGELSQTFVAQVVRQTDDLGWPAWVLSRAPAANRALFPFPPDDRIVHPCRPRRARQVHGRLARRTPRERGLDWWGPPIQRLAPALLHVHFGWIGADAAFERLGIPWLVSFHGSDVRLWPHQSRANRRAFDAMLEALPCATASSHSIANELRALGYDGRLEVLHPGVALDDFPARTPLAPPDEVRLLYVGRQVAFKGLDVLIGALPAILRGEPRVRLVVIGDGEMRARNEELARRLGVADRVEFRGAQGAGAVARALAEAHVFVLPSRTTPAGEAEGHPVAPKEAMAAGVPVVATDSGGVAEVIPPQHRHELAADGDSDSLAQAVLRVAADPGSWGERALIGRRWVEEQFDARRLARRLVALYSDLAEGRSASPPSEEVAAGG